jgi:hypothetical protein
MAGLTPGCEQVAAFDRAQADGAFVCHLAVPRAVSPYEFGSDYIVGKLRGAATS